MGLHMGNQWPGIKDLQPAHALQSMMHMMGLPAPPASYGQLAGQEALQITYPEKKMLALENAQASKAGEGRVIEDGSAAGTAKSTTDMAATIIANMSKGTKRPLATPLTKKESDLAAEIIANMSKKKASKCKDTQKVKPATPLSKKTKQASKHKDTSTKKLASTMPRASPALLKFNGVPKKNPGPLHHTRWTVYTDMTAQSWRVMKKGDKKDKAHWPNDRGCWAPWG